MGEVVQLRDFQQPKDIARMNKDLEKEEVKVLVQAFDGVRDDNIALAERIWRKRQPIKNPHDPDSRGL